MAPGRTQSLVSMHGTTGQHASRISEFTYEVPDAALLVMHSDGLSARWDLQQYPGLLMRHPSVVAGTLFRDHTRGRDDSCVVVLPIGKR